MGECSHQRHRNEWLTLQVLVHYSRYTSSAFLRGKKQLEPHLALSFWLELMFWLSSDIAIVKSGVLAHYDTAGWDNRKRRQRSKNPSCLTAFSAVVKSYWRFILSLHEHFKNNSKVDRWLWGPRSKACSSLLRLSTLLPCWGLTQPFGPPLQAPRVHSQGLISRSLQSVA